MDFLFRKAVITANFQPSIEMRFQSRWKQRPIKRIFLGLRTSVVWLTQLAQANVRERVELTITERMSAGLNKQETQRAQIDSSAFEGGTYNGNGRFGERSTLPRAW